MLKNNKDEPSHLSSRGEPTGETAGSTRVSERILDKYLNSVEYAFDKGSLTTKKFSVILNNIPELNSKRLIQITVVLLFLSLVIFLASCQTNSQYGNRVGSSPLPKPILTSSNLNKEVNKGQEQLYIKREQINIRQRDSGSTSGSIWADSASPKSLVAEFKPSHAGDVVTVIIPEFLQYKPEPATAAGAGAGTEPVNLDPVRNFKFEVIGMEPGGDIFLRGVKNYRAENGDERNIVVLAKVPARNVNGSEVNARDLTAVAVNESINGAQSDYTTTGWDQIVSKKISGYLPDLSRQTAQMDAQKKEIETQKKALADQQKAQAGEAERLKKDRQRLDAEKARSSSAAAPAQQNNKSAAGPVTPAAAAAAASTAPAATPPPASTQGGA